jgi:hypothetical protein
MKKLILISMFMIILIVLAGNKIHSEIQVQNNNIVVDGDVVMGNDPPRYAYTCEEVEVKSAPRFDAPTTSILSINTKVFIRDIGRGYGVNWVMIDKPAQWIPIATLCDW